MSLPPPPLPGDRVGGYTLGRSLGVGASAAVYEAVGAGGERAAVKVLHADQLGFDEVRRFKREILALSSLKHPGIVRVLDAGREGPYPWMAMEFVDGTDLGEEVARWRTSPPADRFARVEAILRGLCEALGVVHGRGIIHRDIKPSNVLVARDGQVKLTDFGVARSEAGMTLPGEQRPVGTLAFMAPEQIRGGPPDPRSDLYALGAVLYQLLTGVQPFVASTVAGYMEQHLKAKPRPPSELDPRVPPRLEAICLRLLQKDPAQRYASARQVLLALERDEVQVADALRGREAELAALLRRARLLAPGRGGMVLVVGPPKSGRSSLLAELARRARAEGQDVACCDSGDTDPVGVLCEQLPDLGASLRPYTDAAQRLVHRARGRPWVLLVDDLDRMEGPALDAITALARDRVAIEGEPLLLVAAVSALDGLVEPLVTGASTGLSPDHVVLGSLDEEAVASIAQDHGLRGMAGRKLGRRLVALGVNQPGAVLERLDALERQGLLVQAARGGLVCARGEDALLEGAGLVAAPVDLAALGASAQAVGQALAALDGEVEEAILVELLGETAPEGLGALVGAGLVRREPGDEDVEARCGFVDPEITTSVIAATPTARQRELHGRLAEVLRGRLSREPRWLPALADQLQRSGQLALAWPALVEAAHRALRLRRDEDAWRLLRRAQETRGLGEPAMDASDRLATRVALYAVEGTLWSLEQAWERAAEAWQQGVESAVAARDAEAARRARVGLAQALLGVGSFDEALATANEALDGMAQGDPSWPRLVALRAVLQLARGDARGAAAGWEALARFAGAVGQRAAQGNATAWLAEIALLEDQPRDALRYALQGQQLVGLSLADQVRLCATRVAASPPGPERDAAARAGAALVERGLQRGEAGLGAPAISLCRALLDAGNADEALRLLPAPAQLSADPLDAPRVQRLALLARLTAPHEPDDGAALARQALALPLPRLPWLAALVAFDLVGALAGADAEGARSALEGARAAVATGELALLRRRLAAFS